MTSLTKPIAYKLSILEMHLKSELNKQAYSQKKTVNRFYYPVVSS